MPLILPNDIINGELADAVPVEENYNLIQGYINSEVINRDGGVAMTAPLLLSGPPTAANQAANKSYVDAILPVGIMLPWPAAVAPAGGSGSWLLCNGATVATSTYPQLFALIGVRFGGSGGSFMLPNMVGKMMIGINPDRTELNTIGKTGGTHAVPVPAHNHSFSHLHPMPHTHEHPHTHSIAHNHPSVTTDADGGHDHDFSWVQDLAHAGGDGARIVGYVGGGLHAAVSTEPDHTHDVDVPNFTGNSGATSEATTGASSVANTGPTNVAGALTSTAGVAGAEMTPPFVVVHFIIRAA